MQKHSGYVQAKYESIVNNLFCIDEFIGAQEIRIAWFKLNILTQAFAWN